MRWIWVGVGLLAVISPSWAQSAQEEATSVVTDERAFQEEKRSYQRELELEQIKADRAEALARAAEARRRAEGDDGSAEGEESEDPASMLESLDAAALRVKLGLPPTGPIVPESSPEPAPVQPLPQMPMGPPPASMQPPTLVSTVNDIGVFRVGARLVRAGSGQDVNDAYSVLAIGDGEVILEGPQGKETTLVVSWGDEISAGGEGPRPGPASMGSGGMSPGGGGFDPQVGGR